MIFNFKDLENKKLLTECNIEFNKLSAKDAIFYSHYELAEHTDISAESWKKFLTNHLVSSWLSEEVELIKLNQYNKMIQRATTNDKSVGTAQMINALDKSLNKENNGPEGPAFIYCYVPLAKNQKDSDNIIELKEDIFWKD